MSAGNRRQLIYIPEVTYGVTPANPACKILRNTGGSGIKIGRETLQSQEFRTDRAIADVRSGNRKPSLDIPFEFSFSSQDDFLEGALFGTFTTAYTLTGLTVTVVASARTLTRPSGSWITDGIKPGDKIITSGFAAGGNNGTFKVDSVTATVITLTVTATGLVNVTSATGIGVTTDKKILKQGVTQKSFSIEEGFTDMNQYMVLTGAIVGSFSLDVKPNSMITGSFSMMGKGITPFSPTTITSNPTAVSANSPFDSYTGNMLEGGNPIAIVTDISLSLNNNAEQLFALFNPDAYKASAGRANLTGTVGLHFEDVVMANKYLNETETSIAFTLIDILGNAYRFTIPRLKYTDMDKSISENNNTISLPFQALHNQTDGTSFIIEKLPA